MFVGTVDRVFDALVEVVDPSSVEDGVSSEKSKSLVPVGVGIGVVDDVRLALLDVDSRAVLSPPPPLFLMQLSRTASHEYPDGQHPPTHSVSPRSQSFWQ